jgi:hypothetical protein
VRVAPNQKMVADGWVSPWGGGGTARVAVENASGAIAILASEADRPS